jgi:hypothetical protein
MLQKLMEHIGEEEENEADDKICEMLHSFWPEEWPENVSQVDLSKREKDQWDRARTPAAKLRALKRSRRYLPCHYFDYICGTSTGA